MSRFRFISEHRAEFGIKRLCRVLQVSRSVRHRVSRSGDRKLNYALYMMAIVQIRHPTAGQAYYRRKRAEGKAPKEALRCLKRRLSDAVYRCLLADQHQPGSPIHDRS